MNITPRAAAPGNYGVGRKNKISRITFHHIVGDAPAAISRFQTSGEEVSATYVIGSDGRVYQCVLEEDTPYTDANSDSNSRSITIEHAGGHPSVPYTDAMYKSSAKLVAGLIDKYGIKDFKRHRDVSSTPTACPGELDVERILKEAKQEEPMTKQEAVAILDAFFGRLVGRKVKQSELDEYIPVFLSGNPDKFFKKAAEFDEVKEALGTKGQATPLKPGVYKVGE